MRFKVIEIVPKAMFTGVPHLIVEFLAGVVKKKENPAARVGETFGDR